MNQVARLITKIQARWRGYLQRKRFLKLHQGDLRQVGQSFNRVSAKGVQFRDEPEPAATKKGAQPTAEQKKAEAEKKKKQQLQQAKLKKKKSETIESKMSAIVRPPKEKVNEKLNKLREELSHFIKHVLLEEIITAAQCYGESLIVGRTIQENFEKRPVTKYVFPMI